MLLGGRCQINLDEHLRRDNHDLVQVVRLWVLHVGRGVAWNGLVEHGLVVEAGQDGQLRHGIQLQAVEFDRPDEVDLRKGIEELLASVSFVHHVQSTSFFKAENRRLPSESKPGWSRDRFGG